MVAAAKSPRFAAFKEPPYLLQRSLSDRCPLQRPYLAPMHRAGKELDAEAGGDIGKSFENLGRGEATYRDRLVERVSRQQDYDPAEQPAPERS
jgi:hypothetical protein